jgi:hypothetical protein
MCVFSCTNCLREFARKDYLKKHLGRKKPCIKNEFLKKSQHLVHQKSTFSQHLVNIKNDIFCDYCKKKFAFKQSKYRHMKKCKKKNKKI